MQRLTVQDALRQAMELARAGQHEPAARLLHGVLATTPDQPDALQLLGMIARSNGAHRDAVAYFQRSLTISPHQPHVLNNLGNALLALGRNDEAVQAYRDALRLKSDYADARLNMGLALLAAGELGAARDTLEQAVQAAPRDGKAWAALGRTHRAAGHLEEAVTAFDTSLEIRPGHIATMHNLGVALRLSGRAREALTLLEHCAAADPRSGEIRYNLGHCLQDLGDFAAAIAAYRAAIAIRPDDREAHDSLARLHWQTGDLGDYLASYEDALKRNPDDTGLLADFANRLNLGGRAQEAMALLSPVIARGVESGALRHRMAQALWARGETAAALGHLEAARALAPGDTKIARELARSLIILEQLDDAQEVLTSVLGSDPHDQQAIAYQALCWGLSGDPRAGRINDYNRFVSVRTLQPPPSMGDVSAFNARLETVLAALHTMTQHPLEQTLRGGTQTVGDLLDRDIPEIAMIRTMIEAGIRDYIAALPDDPDHPFFGRKAGHFRFNGSWSVRLRDSGFHMNHLHPEGWISSCYYVGLPEAVDFASGHQGWLKFGETALDLGARESIAQLVRPAVGTLVLFPSYFYHGTVPFAGDDHRTTIAFDVVPD